MLNNQTKKQEIFRIRRDDFSGVNITHLRKSPVKEDYDRKRGERKRK